MATLEKIRSKKKLVFIILTIALLAFILGIGDLMSQCTRTSDTIAKANGVEVKYEAYRNKVSEINQQNPNVDNGVVEQRAINELLFQGLLEKEYDALGITVTDAEISAAMTGETPHPAVSQFITSIAQQAGLPEANGRLVYDLMKNPAKYNLPVEAGKQIEQMWIAQEKQLEDAIKQQVYGTLISGLFTANKLDAKSVYDDTQSRSVKIVSVPLSNVKDEDVTVTDEDILAAYNNVKGQYRINEETRAIEYIKVDIVPSSDDRTVAQHEVEDAIIGLKTKPGVDAINSNTHFVRDTRNSGQLTAAKIKENSKLRSFPDSLLTEGGVAQLSFDGITYTIAKVLGTTSEIEEVDYSFVPVPNKATGDSVLALINDGRSFASFAEEFLGPNPQTGRMQQNDSVKVPLINADQQMKDIIKGATVGVPFLYTDSIQGQEVASVIRVNSRSAVVPYYDMAVYTYTVEPSTETINKLNADLHAFLANNANNKAFVEEAAKAGYNVVSTIVSPSSPMIDNIPDSRNPIKWAMDADKGKVSPIFNDSKQTYLLAVALDDIYSGDYEPSTSPRLQADLKQRALNNKKAAKLIDQYKDKAKDVDGYAKVMGVEVTDAEAAFGQPYIQGIGFGEEILQGNIAGAEKGKVVGPIQANNSVVVFTVTGDVENGRAFDFDNDAPRFIQQFNVFGTNLYGLPMNLMLNGEKIKNNSIKLMQSVEE